MEKLILVVSEHRTFGWKYNIYYARVLESGSLEILGTPAVESEIKKGVPETDIALIKLIEEVSDHALMKAYSKHTSTVSFRNEVSGETIRNLIRPRIEQNIVKVTEMAANTGIPVYLRESLGSKILYERYLIEIQTGPADCIFHFIKDQQGLRYFISLHLEGKDIPLQEKPALVLSGAPSVILLDNKIYRVCNIESKKLVPFFDKAYISVPAEAETNYIRSFILKTFVNYEVNIQGIPIQAGNPEKKGLLIVEEDFQQRITLSLFFLYNQQRINPAQKKIRHVELQTIEGIETICWFDRDIEWENSLKNKLYDAGLRQEGNNHYYLRTDLNNAKRFGIVEWLNTHTGIRNEFEIIQHTQYTYYTGDIKITSLLDTKIDWFDLEMQVVVGDFKIPFNRFRKHILNGDPEFVLPDERIFILPEEWFHTYTGFFLHSQDEGEKIRVKKMHVGILNKSIHESFEENDKPDISTLRQTETDKPEPSPALKKLLRPYQLQGFEWLVHLYHAGLGGCLADEMGLGKTIQTISLLEYIYRDTIIHESAGEENGQYTIFSPGQSHIPASLIVAPTSLLYNWQNEIKKFAPHLRVYMYAGGENARVQNRLRNYLNITILSFLPTD